jgi:hypothetical protein
MVRSASVPPVPSNWIVYVTPEEVFREAPSLERVKQLLAEIPRAVMTDVTCKMGVLGDSDDHEAWVDLDRRELRAVFLEPDAKRRVDLLDSQSTSDARLAFCRPQALLALRLAQRLCPDVDEEKQSGETLKKIGTALIHVSGLLVSPVDSEENRPTGLEESKAHVAAMMISLFDVSNPSVSPHSIKRTFEMTLSPRWNGDPDLVAAQQGFLNDTGLTPVQYLKFLALLLSRFTREPSREVRARIDMDGILQHARDRAGFRKVLNLISTPYSELPAAVPPPEEAIKDLTTAPFRSKPLICFPGERYTCSDSAFLRMLMTTGLFWKLKACLPKEQHVGLFRAWGELFEEYVHATLEPLLKKKYIKSPQGNDGEITDALVDYGESVVLIEVKAVIVPDALKYARDLSAILNLLEDRLLKEDQIVRALSRLFGPEADPAATNLFRKARISEVFPMIVSYDHSICAPFLEEYLQKRLRERIDAAHLPRGLRVAPLTIASADDVEILVPLLHHGMNLASLLKRRIEQRRPDISFHNFLYAVGRETGVPLRAGPAHQRVMDESLQYWKDQGLPDGLRW